jgi:tight adherence protein B
LTRALLAATCVSMAARANAGARRARVTARLPVPAARRDRAARAARPVATRLDRALRRAGLSITPMVAVQGWLVAVASVSLLTAAILPSAVPLTALTATIVPPSLLHLARHRADRAVGAALPAALRAVAGELAAGGTVRAAIARLSTGGSAVERDFARIDARLRLGASLDAALAPWPRERPLAGVRAVAGALVTAAELGGASAGALEGLAASLAERLAVAAETRALSAQARLSAAVVGAAPLGYLAFTAMLDRGALRALTATAVGRTCLAVGLLLDTLAIMWMRRLVREPRWSW